jgi:hypothetical protein
VNIKVAPASTATVTNVQAGIAGESSRGGDWGWAAWAWGLLVMVTEVAWIGGLGYGLWLLLHWL